MRWCAPAGAMTRGAGTGWCTEPLAETDQESAPPSDGGFYGRQHH
jgi:hypothetical protein